MTTDHDNVYNIHKLIQKIDNTEDYARVKQSLKNHRPVLEDILKSKLREGDEVTVLDNGKEIKGIIQKINRTRAKVKLFDYGTPDAVWNVPLSVITLKKEVC